MARISEIMLMQRTEQPALVIETVTDINRISRVIEESFMKIDAYLEEQGELPADVPFVTYLNHENMNEKCIRMLLGFKLSKALPGKEEIKAVQMPAQKIVTCLYRGDYTGLEKLYGEISEWIKSKGYKESGISIEYYYTGPAFSENEQVTMIEIPLK